MSPTILPVQYDANQWPRPWPAPNSEMVKDGVEGANTQSEPGQHSGYVLFAAVRAKHVRVVNTPDSGVGKDIDGGAFDSGLNTGVLSPVRRGCYRVQLRRFCRCVDLVCARVRSWRLDGRGRNHSLLVSQVFLDTDIIVSHFCCSCLPVLLLPPPQEEEDSHHESQGEHSDADADAC